MNQHVPDDLLHAFVQGELGEQVAVHVAEHLDTCPACATQAAGLEPLAAAFAAVEDPVPPPDLVDGALRRLREPARPPLAEIAVGAGLLLCAAALAIALQSPVSLAADFGASFHALDALGQRLAGAASSSRAILGVLTALAAGGVIGTLQMARAGIGASALERLGWSDPARRIR